MAFAAALAQRVRDALAGQPGLEEKRMFGGIAFMVHSNMCCGVHKENLMVRVGPQRHSEALMRPHTREFDLTGRPMAGWVIVSPAGLGSAGALEAWVGDGLAYALSLPPK